MTEQKPPYLIQMEKTFGGPSSAGWGTAVFFAPVASDDALEEAALVVYKQFIGDKWDRFGEKAWMGTWKMVYDRMDGDAHDILAELQTIKDRSAAQAIDMIVQEADNAAEAQEVLELAYNDPSLTELHVYNIGDGDALSGIEIAGRRSNGETTFLTFLLD